MHSLLTTPLPSAVLPSWKPTVITKNPSRINLQRTASLLIPTSSCFSHASQEGKQNTSIYKSFDRIFCLHCKLKHKWYTRAFHHSTLLGGPKLFSSPDTWRSGAVHQPHAYRASKPTNPDFSNRNPIHLKWQEPGSAGCPSEII